MSLKCFRRGRRYAGLLSMGFSLAWSPAGQAQLPFELVDKLNAYPHAVEVSQAALEVRDHEVGLGAIKKVRGVWQFKKSERLSGSLDRHTWQIVDGFSSLEVFEGLVAELESAGAAELLFACEGRSCGQGVQWANRVFGERILYGREELQRYSVYALTGETTFRVILYSSARTADRQHLHMESLELAPGDEP
ncbi:MAG: DUF4892 domain-containing protein [Halioglobus sp.]